MKRLIQIAALIVAAVIIMNAVALYPRLSNMQSEYDTAQAIRDIDSYVRENHGQWPSSPEQLQNKYPFRGDVMIDYTLTSGELIANPAKLRNAVRPRSGRFYTYPHYDLQIDGLLLALQESSPSEQAVAPSR